MGCPGVLLQTWVYLAVVGGLLSLRVRRATWQGRAEAGLFPPSFLQRRPTPPRAAVRRSGLVCSPGAGGCSQAGKRCSIWGNHPRTSVLVSSLNSEASAAELVCTSPGCGARACHALPSSCPRDAGLSAPAPWPRVLRRVHSLCARPPGRPARVQPAPPQAAPLWPGQGPSRCVHGTGRDRRGQDHSWAAQASGSCSCGHVPFFC